MCCVFSVAALPGPMRDAAVMAVAQISVAAQPRLMRDAAVMAVALLLRYLVR